MFKGCILKERNPKERMPERANFRKERGPKRAMTKRATVYKSGRPNERQIKKIIIQKILITGLLEHKLYFVIR